MAYRLLWVPVTVAIFTAGCAAQPPPMAQIPARSGPPPHIMESRASDMPATAVSQAEPELESLTVKKLTMADALKFTLKYSPLLKSFATEYRARDFAALQAGLPPNPELGVEVENFAGQDDLQDFDGAETSIVLSQLFELGAKRDRRHKLATTATDLAQWDYQGKKLDILASVSKAFLEVLLAQEQVRLNNELADLAEITASAVGERADAGKVSPIEKIRTQVELAAARSEATTAAHELEVAKRRLAGFWGGAGITFSRAVGDLTDITPPPTEETLNRFLRNNPDLARWESERGRSEAALALARSEGVPDLTVSAGVRHFQETGDNALIAGISLPLPLFNRNQGGIGEARANLEKTQHEHMAAKAAAQTDLSETWQKLAAVYVEASTFRDTILPGAQDAYESTEIGYREGKLDLLRMLDAQRTLFQVKRQYLQALGSYHMMNTDLERLIGVSLKGLTQSTIDNKS